MSSRCVTSRLTIRTGHLCPVSGCAFPAAAIGPQHLVRVSSVSGGSITAGLLGLKWQSLTFDGANVATNLGPMIIKPIRDMASTTIDVCAILKGKLLAWTNV